VQHEIGAQIGRFAYAIHTALSVDDTQRTREQLELGEQTNESWEEGIEKYLRQYTFPTPEQDAVAKEYYAKWQALPKTPSFVVHDDLHTHNLLFVDNQLHGVLDFGDTTVGTAEQELRHLFWINDDTLQSGVRAYEQLAGRSLDIEASRVWAIVQELVAYGGRGSAGHTGHPSFVRACANLNRWSGSDMWGSGAGRS
jgi:aminoglycoside phosphotransferase (APT) family kinase protein